MTTIEIIKWMCMCLMFGYLGFKIDNLHDDIKKIIKGKKDE